jgi:TetR/AcrR family transcriptional regulator, cholesterol catabolism regulator
VQTLTTRSSRRQSGGSRWDILTVFTRRVAELGYDETNFDAIAAELGISKGTIVHHFGTKERLFAEAHENYMTRRLREAEAIVSHFDSPAEQLAALVAAFALYQTHGRFATVAFQREFARFRSAESMATSRELRVKYRNLLIDVLERGMNTGVFRRGNAHIWSLQIFGGTQWMWTWFDPHGDLSNETIACAYVDFVLSAMLVDRSVPPELTDPEGDVMRSVYFTIETVPESIGRIQP